MKKTKPTSRVGMYSQGRSTSTARRRSTNRRTTYPANWDELKKAVKLRDKGRCCNCGKDHATVRAEGMYLEVDHIVRLADGGTNSMLNLQTLCTNCHKNRANHRHLRIRK